MRRLSWEIKFSIILIAISSVLYVLHYVLFRDSHHIYLWSLTALAFLPISVLFVTMVINKILAGREKSIKMKKLNIVISVFFNEFGNQLLTYLSEVNKNINDIKEKLIITDEWNEEHFYEIAKHLKKHDFELDNKKIDFLELRNLLKEKRDFILRLLENPNLLEYERFTNLLWAVSHVAEELTARKNLKNLKEKDAKHIAGDIKRIYGLLIYEWLEYMDHLKQNYPYLFSLSMRINPFDPDASPEVE